MANEFEGTGWAVVDYEETGDVEAPGESHYRVVTLAMQLGVGVLVRVATAGGDGVIESSAPFGWPGAVLEVVEESGGDGDGLGRVRIVGETSTLIDKARRFDADRRGIESRENIGKRLDAALAKCERLDKDRGRLLTELAESRKAEAVRVQSKRIP
ncbi:hypothetical protein LCGC14_1524010 [marine sediment metagenome]|uniref:Uncharacterized protein n=1 Tax=marine sediment metagenome TaxID=412755 RepID=A0A0F9IXU2_9ZZZZ